MHRTMEEGYSTREPSSATEMAKAKQEMGSPTESQYQQTVSDDDEIDYSVKPEFYDPELDTKDELWVQKKKKGSTSDAVLSCPACFTTLCLESQRHEIYVTQYRAVYVLNCNIGSGKVLQKNNAKPKRGKRGRDYDEIEGHPTSTIESVKPVCCSVCTTNVGVMDEDEIYHFFNVIPSEP